MWMAWPQCDTSLVCICVPGECALLGIKRQWDLQKHNCAPPLCFRKLQSHFFSCDTQWVHATYIEVSFMYKKTLHVFLCRVKPLRVSFMGIGFVQGPYSNKPLSLWLWKTQIPFIEHYVMQKVVDSAQNMVFCYRVWLFWPTYVKYKKKIALF